jgi:hypothetical protein
MRNEIILIAFGVAVLFVMAMYIYLNKGGKSETSQTDDDSSNGDKRLDETLKLPKENPHRSNTSTTDQKLDKIYEALENLRWIGIGIGCMLALALFVIPQCAKG